MAYLKSLLIFPFLLITITGISQESNPFNKIIFDKVVMYDFESDGEKGGSIVDGKGILSNKIIKKITLDSIGISNLNSKLINSKSFGESPAACFEPHLGFVYYSRNKIVGYITICMDCNRLKSSFKLPAQLQNKMGKGKDAYYLGDGMSKSFRKFLNSLLKKYSFSHQTKF